MRKIHLGCGSRHYPTWENYDREVDFTKPLPFDDNSVDYFFTNHAIEHINIRETYDLLKEMYRCLKPGGVARIQVPDIHRTYHYAELIPEYIQERSNGDLTKLCENIMFDFGHKTVFTEQLLDTLLKLCRFTTIICNQNQSSFFEIQTALDAHDKCDIYRVETTCIEGIKKYE